MEIKKEKTAELISYISHEIKNSLNPVINLSGIMLKEKQRELSSDEREYLDVIGRNGRKILALVDHLSYINRSKTGNLLRSFASASIKSAIENSINALSGYRNINSIKPHCIIENGRGEINFDSDSFKRIISCITEFFISIQNPNDLYFRVSSDESVISITISGISPDESGIPAKESIPAFNFSETGETSLLWFYLAEELLSISGGASDIRQFSEGNAMWFVVIPVSAANRKIEAGSVEVDEAVLRKFILMVIDDDPDTLIPVKAIAEHEFHGLCSIVHACTGSEGIDLLDKIRPDIILLDLSLPDINGMSLVRNIRNFFTRESVAVIAFTGHDLGFNREKLINSGFDDIIIKPFHIDEFIEKIRRWIK